MRIITMDTSVKLDLLDGPRVIASTTVGNRELENALAWMCKLVRSMLESDQRGGMP